MRGRWRPSHLVCMADLLGMIKMNCEGTSDPWMHIDHSTLTAQVPPVKRGFQNRGKKSHQHYQEIAEHLLS